MFIVYKLVDRVQEEFYRTCCKQSWKKVIFCNIINNKYTGLHKYCETITIPMQDGYPLSKQFIKNNQCTLNGSYSNRRGLEIWVYLATVKHHKNQLQLLVFLSFLHSVTKEDVVFNCSCFFSGLFMTNFGFFVDYQKFRVKKEKFRVKKEKLRSNMEILLPMWRYRNKKIAGKVLETQQWLLQPSDLEASSAPS